MDRVEVDGDLVRRPAYPWTSTVHALLRHLLAAGLEVPEPVSIELGGEPADGMAVGTEVVRLVPGVAGPQVWPLQATEPGLRSAARLLRRVHDAARSFVAPEGATWAFPPPPGEDVTILHGDPGPWNMAWRDGVAVGLFDWDLARPGPRLDDVAYALDYLAPLRTDADALRWHGFTEPPARSARLTAFLESYGGAWEPAAVVEAVLARKRRTESEVADLAARGAEPQRTWVAEGYLRSAQEHLEWAEGHATTLLLP